MASTGIREELPYPRPTATPRPQGSMAGCDAPQRDDRPPYRLAGGPDRYYGVD